jgi:hypothetical protein
MSVLVYGPGDVRLVALGIGLGANSGSDGAHLDWTADLAHHGLLVVYVLAVAKGVFGIMI